MGGRYPADERVQLSASCPDVCHVDYFDDQSEVSVALTSRTSPYFTRLIWESQVQFVDLSGIKCNYKTQRSHVIDG